ncbi:MAG: 30S ribosomal protein S8e [Candidatus Pacearchaeota archaeon]
MKKGRKTSGGKYKKSRKKRKHEISGNPRNVRLGERKTKIIKLRGGKKKVVLLSDNKMNLIVHGKAKVVKIKNVLETPSNRFLARQNILVKGAIVDTDLGRAKITNRPSQESQIQGILIEEKT